MKPKAALVKAGLKPAEYENSRGRMSAADKEAAAKVAKDNPSWNVEVPGQPVPKATAAVSTKAKVETPKDSTGVKDVGPPLYHEDAYDVFVTIEGKTKKWDMGPKGCCLNCGGSLTYCPCRYPVVNVDHEVKGIITRKPKK